ncbi:MAG: aminotransferase class I/II-fold pyridoxal phosphate-dependent enzyme [Bdellovibrionales bacterium]|nr:aminotransferase class I/II-fold pyridoxal phosphate-dependent enzyme [Bdellovibrionales bacterium]
MKPLDRRSLLNWGAQATFAAAGASLLGCKKKDESRLLGASRSIYIKNENPLGASPQIQRDLDINFHLANMHRYELYDESLERLKNAISDTEGVSLEQIFVGPGSRHLIYESLLNLHRKGYRRLLMGFPDYGTVEYFAREIGLQIQRLELNHQTLKYDLQRFAQLSDHQTVVYLSNPQLPYGHFFKKEEIRSFRKNLAPGAFLLIDEAYLHIRPEDNQDQSAVGLIDMGQILVFRTFSKLHGLASQRIGYSIGAKENLKECFSSYKKIRIASSVGLDCARISLADKKFQRQSQDTIKEWSLKLEISHWLPPSIQMTQTHLLFIPLTILLKGEGIRWIDPKEQRIFYDQTGMSFWILGKKYFGTYISIQHPRKMKENIKKLLSTLLEHQVIV